MTAPSDETRRTTARRLQNEHPRWLIIWGLHSREYWAFPSLPVPPGTYLHAPHPVLLEEAIREVELAITGWQSR